jgi:hypothetical protein
VRRRQRIVDVLFLLDQHFMSLAELVQHQLELGFLAVIRIVEIERLPDFGQRPSQALAAPGAT